MPPAQTTGAANQLVKFSWRRVEQYQFGFTACGEPSANTNYTDKLRHNGYDAGGTGLASISWRKALHSSRS